MKSNHDDRLLSHYLWSLDNALSGLIELCNSKPDISSRIIKHVDDKLNVWNQYVTNAPKDAITNATNTSSIACGDCSDEVGTNNDTDNPNENVNESHKLQLPPIDEENILSGPLSIDDARKLRMRQLFARVYLRHKESNMDNAFDVFKTKEQPECNVNASDSSKCISMKRLAVALKHYSTLNIMENSDDQEVFRRFMLETYHEVIDDYIHFQKYHGNELEQICDDLINIHKFVECDIERCVFTSRHYQNDRMDQTEMQHMHVLDSHLNFYKDLMDTLHFHLFHCFDTGLRCKKDSGDAKQDLEAAKDCDHFDVAFARMHKAISERQHTTASFARFSTKNTKYNIVMGNEKNDIMDNEDTFPDYLFKHLIAANVDTFDIVQFVSFVKDNEYDTESIEHDHGIKPSGNIATNINSKRCIQQYDQFCTDLKISASSFSIGLRYYYWPNMLTYRDPNMLTFGNHFIYAHINDHSGYNINDLYIEQKYNSFKDEIRNYKYISLEQYDKAVVKVKFYHNAQEIKKNTATRDGTLNNRYYGLDYLAKPQIKFEHLLSLVLYTDYIDLSTDFSSTFRKNNAFETLESMKRRNREYYWMSKWLRECVEMHGQCRMGQRRY
eukprot:497117_1